MRLNIINLSKITGLEIYKNKYCYYKFKLGRIYKDRNDSSDNFYIDDTNECLYEKAKKIMSNQREGNEIIALVKTTEQQKEILDLELINHERLQELVPGFDNVESKNNYEINKNEIGCHVEKIYKKFKEQNDNTFQESLIDDEINNYNYLSLILWIMYLIEMKYKEDIIIDSLKQKYYELYGIEYDPVQEIEEEKENQQEPGIAR